MTANSHGVRFRQVLQQFRNENRLSVLTLAGMLKKPKDTVYKWLDGRHSPSPRTLKEVCRYLGIGYEQFFLPDPIFDQIYQDKFLSLDAVVSRFKLMSQAGHTPYLALALIPTAAALICVTFGLASLPMRMVMDVTFNVTLMCEAEGLTDYGISLTSSKSDELAVRVIQVSENQEIEKTPYHPLNQDVADSLVMYFKQITR